MSDKAKFSAPWYEEKISLLDKQMEKIWDALSIKERRKFLVFIKFQELQKQIYKVKIENKSKLTKEMK